MLWTCSGSLGRVPRRFTVHLVDSWSMQRGLGSVVIRSIAPGSVLYVYFFTGRAGSRSEESRKLVGPYPARPTRLPKGSNQVDLV